MKYNRGLVLWTLVIALSGLVAGCAPLGTALEDTSRTVTDLDSTTWTLTVINSELVAANSEATLDFAEGQGTGIAFCNRFFGSYEQDGNELSFGMLGATVMACPGMNMEHEDEYLEALGAVAGYHRTESDLTLTDPNGDTVLVFSPTEHAALEGTAWHLTSYNTGTAIVILVRDTEITVTLSDGKIKGSAGCNTYFASYTLDGSHIELGPVANTEMYCMEPEGVMDQELDYLVALAMANAYEIYRSTLTVFDAEGMRYLTYSAVSQ